MHSVESLLNTKADEGKGDDESKEVNKGEVVVKVKKLMKEKRVSIGHGSTLYTHLS